MIYNFSFISKCYIIAMVREVCPGDLLQEDILYKIYVFLYIHK